MAVFKVPRISTVNRRALTLEAAEIVFDVGEGLYYGGNGETLGGYPIGSSAPTSTFTLLVTAQDAQQESITLPSQPSVPSMVNLTPAGGIPQINGIDFVVHGNVIQWAGLGLSGFIAEGDILIVSFQ